MCAKAARSGWGTKSEKKLTLHPYPLMDHALSSLRRENEKTKTLRKLEFITFLTEILGNTLKVLVLIPSLEKFLKFRHNI